MNNLYTKMFGRAFYFEQQMASKLNINFELYYKVILECLNCGNKNTVYIKKGRYAKDIASIIRCENCKCTMKDCRCNLCS